MILNMFNEEFQKQSECGPRCFYQTNLIWRDNHPPLKNNKSNSLGKLSSLVKNLTHRNRLERCDNIIQDQNKKGIVEKVDELERNCFICHIDVSSESQPKQLN